MDLAQLRYLTTIAEAGSLSAAARTLGVSQPSLSLAVRHLEEELGVRLFVRTHEGVVPTPHGEALLETAHRVLTDLERTSKRIVALATDDVGEVVIGCHPALGAYFLPGFLSTFLPAYPRIDLRILSAGSTQVVSAVLDGRVTFGLAVNPLPHDDLVLVDLYRDEIALFVRTRLAPDAYGLAPSRTSMPPDAAPEVLKSQALARLRAGPLIHPDIPSFDALVERLAADDLLPPRRIPCGDLELTKALTIAGVGVGLLPRRVAEYGHVGWLRPLHPELPSYLDTIKLVWRYDLYKTRAVQQVREALLVHGGQLAAVFEPRSGVSSP
jgi:DNA-binding transcriptional LysR family regulator